MSDAKLNGLFFVPPEYFKLYSATPPMVAKPHNLTADKADIILFRDSRSVIVSLGAVVASGLDADDRRGGLRVVVVDKPTIQHQIVGVVDYNKLMSPE